MAVALMFVFLFTCAGVLYLLVTTYLEQRHPRRLGKSYDRVRNEETSGYRIDIATPPYLPTPQIITPTSVSFPEADPLRHMGSFSSFTDNQEHGLRHQREDSSET